MLDGYRRGVQVGGDVAHVQPALVGDDAALQTLARRVLAYLERQGYAHLAPHGDFVSGFVTGFQTNRLFSVGRFS